MTFRSFISLLLLANYLLVVGLGCVGRTDGQAMVLIQTDEYSTDYQEKGYLRMDSLETFLTESLASRYADAPETEKHHHILCSISAIDAHCLTATIWPTLAAPIAEIVSPLTHYQSTVSIGTCRAVYSPPWKA